LTYVRTAALSRQEAPQFAALMDDEVIALRLLPAWVRWLYLELVAMSDFKTGHIYTSYARLASLLDCDQPTQGGKRLDVPTIKQIRTALDTLDRMQLALRDKAGNEEKRELKILVRPRQGLGASNAEQGRGKGRPQTPQNYDKHGPERKPDPGAGQMSGQGVQERNSLLPLPLHVDKLSTRAGRSNTSELAPQGGSNRPSGARPPGAHTRPPRGQESALPGHAPRELGDDERAWLAADSAERIRLSRERWAAQRAHEPPGVRVDDPSTWARDADGRLVLPVDHPSNQALRPERGPDKPFWS
jgi:hypothetical protein